MCMLTYFPPGQVPDVEALRNGAEFNRDGHGFAIVARDRIIVQRSMDSDKLIDKFKGLRAALPDGPALFHSRYATHGTKGKFNCHPFRVRGDARTFVGHNGILPTTVQPVKGDRRSDTRVAAEDVLGFEPFDDLDSENVRQLMAEWIGPNNKLVFLTVDPRYTRNAYLINERSGVWDGGVWYSNHDYEGWGKIYMPRTYRVGTALQPYYLTCSMCGAREVSPRTGTCLSCETCNDCYEWAEDCECYLPTSRRGSDPDWPDLNVEYAGIAE